MTTKEIKKEIAHIKKLKREAERVEKIHRRNASKAGEKSRAYEAKAAQWRQHEQEESTKKEKAIIPFLNARVALMAKLSPSELDKYMDHI